MHEVRTLGRKLLNLVVIASTTIGTLGLTAMPMSVSAASCPTLKTGQFVQFGAKAKVSFIKDGNRWTFINNDAPGTWTAAKAKRVDAKCAASYPEAGKIGYRPGSKLVKVNSIFFAVGPDNTLFELAGATVSKALYGASWKGLAKTAPAGFYTMGTGLDEALAHNGMLLKKKGDKVVWFVDGGELVKVTGKLPTLLSRDVRTVAASAIEGLEVSSETTTAAKIVADPTQGAVADVSETPTSVSPEPSPAPVKDGTSKTDTKTDTAPGTINSGLFHNANYTGPFPAPAGLVLKGTYGNDKFQDPTGSGDYRYQIQTAWERPVVCLDDTRHYIESKGGSYDLGYQTGVNMANTEANSIKPIYDDTPKGPNVGKIFFNEAYKLGYYHRWNGSLSEVAQRNCPHHDFTAADFAKYDTDGWYKNDNIEKLKTTKAIYSPLGSFGYSSQSALGGESVSLDFNAFGGISEEIEKSTYNNKTGNINLSRIDFLETDVSAEELALGPEGIMKALFDQQSAEIKKQYGNTLAFINLQTYKPVLDLKSEKPYIVETQTYGKNKITVLQYITAKGGKWNLSNYGLRIDPKTNTGLLFFFYNPKDISNETKNGVDVAKASSDFLAQLLTKMEFANY